MHSNTNTLLYCCLQVLVQKEWVWFGHPFHLRHSRHGKAKEDGPIFLQWVDCVWQVHNHIRQGHTLDAPSLLINDLIKCLLGYLTHTT